MIWNLFQEYSADFHVLPWPENSSDLIPVEYGWGMTRTSEKNSPGNNNKKKKNCWTMIG